MSLLLLISGVGGGAVTPLIVSPILTIISPDQVATGLEVRIWAEQTDNTTASTVTSPQIRIFYLDAIGVRSAEISLANMNGLGEAYYYDWTPSKAGTFQITVAATTGTGNVMVAESVTARAKFDPIALALHDTLVSRF